MRRILIIAMALIGFVSAVHAEQGPNFPSLGSDRGPNFPSSVSPTESNQTNWVARQHEYTDPSGPNARWNLWHGRRGWRGGWW
jgi:hypothetical protein